MTTQSLQIADLMMDTRGLQGIGTQCAHSDRQRRAVLPQCLYSSIRT